MVITKSTTPEYFQVTFAPENGTEAGMIGYIMEKMSIKSDCFITEVPKQNDYNAFMVEIDLSCIDSTGAATPERAALAYIKDQIAVWSPYYMETVETLGKLKNLKDNE